MSALRPMNPIPSLRDRCFDFLCEGVRRAETHTERSDFLRHLCAIAVDVGVLHHFVFDLLAQLSLDPQKDKKTVAERLAALNAIASFLNAYRNLNGLRVRGRTLSEPSSESAHVSRMELLRRHSQEELRPMVIFHCLADHAMNVHTQGRSAAGLQGHSADTRHTVHEEVRTAARVLLLRLAADAPEGVRVGDGAHDWALLEAVGQRTLNKLVHRQPEERCHGVRLLVAINLPKAASMLATIVDKESEAFGGHLPAEEAVKALEALDPDDMSDKELKELKRTLKAAVKECRKPFRFWVPVTERARRSGWATCTYHYTCSSLYHDSRNALQRKQEAAFRAAARKQARQQQAAERERAEAAAREQKAAAKEAKAVATAGEEVMNVLNSLVDKVDKRVGKEMAAAAAHVPGASTASAGPSTASAGPSTASAEPSTAIAGPSSTSAGPSMATCSPGPSTASAGPSTPSTGPKATSSCAPQATHSPKKRSSSDAAGAEWTTPQKNKCSKTSDAVAPPQLRWAAWGGPMPPGLAVVGKHVRVWFDGDEAWHAGEVSSYSRRRGYQVVYDKVLGEDDLVDWLALDDEDETTWEVAL